MWRRETAAATKPVSLSEAKAQCRIEEDDTDSDLLLAGLIAAATDAVEQMVGFVLGEETWMRAWVGVGAGGMAVPLYPVKSLVSVTRGPDELTGFALVGDDGHASITGPWPADLVTVRVTVGGFVPPAVKHAILLLIAQWYDNREAISENPMREVPFSVESLVGLYRRGWAAS